MRELVGELDFSFTVDTPTLVTVSTVDTTKGDRQEGPRYPEKGKWVNSLA